MMPGLGEEAGDCSCGPGELLLLVRAGFNFSLVTTSSLESFMLPTLLMVTIGSGGHLSSSRLFRAKDFFSVTVAFSGSSSSLSLFKLKSNRS